jgi:capsular polysaccharide biosynthesis protein
LVAGGVFLGGVLGIGAVLLLEMRDKRFRDEAGLVGLLGVPVLGRIGNARVGPRDPEPAVRKFAPI